MGNEQLKAACVAEGITFIEDAVTPEHIKKCMDDGVGVFVSAGYPYKIPPIPEPARGINLHPTLLPEGRGIIPMPYLILENEEAAGITIHKLSDKFDHGDILLQHPFKLTPHEDVEMLMARVALKAPDLLSQVLANLNHFWDNAKPQSELGEGSHYKNPTNEMRRLDFTKTVAELDKLRRAFGKIGTLMAFQDQIFIILDFSVWQEDHDHTPGDIVLELPSEMVIAVADGYVVLKNAVPVDPQ